VEAEDLTEIFNLLEVVKREKNEEILEKRVKRLVQVCLENPELNVEVLTRFLNRQIKWDTIESFILCGHIVNCKLCGEMSFSRFWCKPCIHPNWCCFCCILLGIPFYR
jgi:hypothetical protein